MNDAETGWQFVSADQKQAMDEPVTMQNCGSKLKLVQELASLSRRELARILGVSEATIRRLESKEYLPTEAFMNRLIALCLIGAPKYRKMSEAQREKLSEKIGTGVGIGGGVGAAIGAVAAAGEVAGLSAAGITSGIAAIGGGTMLAGIAVIAVIPVITGAAGYGVIKGIKAICDANKLSSEEVNGRWEIKNNV